MNKTTELTESQHTFTLSDSQLAAQLVSKMEILVPHHSPEILTELSSNITKLYDLNNRMTFVMKEIKTLLKA